jgi:hypothetical protein
MVQVTSGCRDCKKCTNSSIANFGRDSGRASAAILSIGISELARVGTKNCRICGHKLSLHQAIDYVQPRQTVASPAVSAFTAPAAWYAEPGTGRRRWWDGTRWTIYAEEWGQPAPAEVEGPLTTLNGGDTSAATDVEQRLAVLAALHSTGALTDDEFSAAKRAVLGL